MLDIQMTLRPKRNVKPSVVLKEYVILPERDKYEYTEKFNKSSLDKVIYDGGNSRAVQKCSDRNIFLCKKCDLKFLSKEELTLHGREHQHGRGSYLCEDCGKSLSSLQAFTEHSNIHKNIKPFKCEICGHESRQWSVHSRHLITHEKDVNVYSCTICSKSFRSKIYLKFHINKHLSSEEKPYSCGDCPKKFTTKRELNRHKISHSSLRPFECSHCMKRFKLKHNLQAHIKSHKGKQSWRCHLCDACFPQSSLLKAHQQIHRELIQHVELSKVDNRTINVMTFPLDRRKVSQYQKLTLPASVNLDDKETLTNTKLSLCLNDVVFPLSVIANSFGTGNYIKVKIIDPKPKSSNSTVPTAAQPMKAFLSEVDSDLHEKHGEENARQPSKNYNSSVCEYDSASKKHNLMEELQFLFTSFNEGSKAEVFVEDTMRVVKSIAALIVKLGLPLEHSVSQKLNVVISYLQKYLVENNSDCVKGSFAENASSSLVISSKTHNESHEGTALACNGPLTASLDHSSLRENKVESHDVSLPDTAVEQTKTSDVVYEGTLLDLPFDSIGKNSDIDIYTCHPSATRATEAFTKHNLPVPVTLDNLKQMIIQTSQSTSEVDKIEESTMLQSENSIQNTQHISVHQSQLKTSYIFPPKGDTADSTNLTDTSYASATAVTRGTINRNNCSDGKSVSDCLWIRVYEQYCVLINVLQEHFRLRIEALSVVGN